MTVARFPTLAHWGAYTALVENGRVVGCEPFARDPAPSDMLNAIPTMVHSPLRVTRPAVRKKFGNAAIFGGSYGWPSAGRVHHARTLVRRFLSLGGGFVDQAGNYSWGAAQFLLPHVIGTFQPVNGKVTDWSSIV